MKNQSELVHETNWDIMLVIDACRFDYFEAFYKDVLGDIGKLQKTISPANWTLGWYIEVFGGREMKDTILISSNECVNSKGPMTQPIHDLSRRFKYKEKFDGPKCFEKIIDAWDYGYDKVRGLVLPDYVTDNVIKEVKENPNSRVMAKYWQAHDPFYCYVKEVNPVDADNLITKNKQAYRFTNLKKIVSTILNDESQWKLRKFLRLNPSGGLAELWIKYGKEGIINGYTEDVKVALENCKKIIDTFPEKNIVVTADHGEMLGEHGRYSHVLDRYYKEIKEVPWLEINARNRRN